MTGAHDSLVLLFVETRQQRPPVYLAEEWCTWLAAMGQVMAAFPTPERRWASTVLVADDLVRAMPGLSLSLAFGAVDAAVRQASEPRVNS